MKHKEGSSRVDKLFACYIDCVILLQSQISEETLLLFMPPLRLPNRNILTSNGGGGWPVFQFCFVLGFHLLKLLYITETYSRAVYLGWCRQIWSNFCFRCSPVSHFNSNPVLIPTVGRQFWVLLLIPTQGSAKIGGKEPTAKAAALTAGGLGFITPNYLLSTHFMHSLTS